MQIPGPVSRHAAAEFRNPAEPGRLVRTGGALHDKRFGESGITPGQDQHGFSGPAHDRRIAARRTAFQERFEPVGEDRPHIRDHVPGHRLHEEGDFGGQRLEPAVYGFEVADERRFAVVTAHRLDPLRRKLRRRLEVVVDRQRVAVARERLDPERGVDQRIARRKGVVLRSGENAAFRDRQRHLLRKAAEQFAGSSRIVRIGSAAPHRLALAHPEFLQVKPAVHPELPPLAVDELPESILQNRIRRIHFFSFRYERLAVCCLWYYNIMP